MQREVSPIGRRGRWAVLALVSAAMLLSASLAWAAYTGSGPVSRWPWYAGGAAIGLFGLVFVRSTGRLLGVSTGFYDICQAALGHAEAKRSWRLPFLSGIVLGGLLARLSVGAWELTWGMDLFDQAVSASLAVKLPVFAAGGVAVGLGARLAGGCTSGHAIVGVALLAPSSLIATGGFMAAGFAVANLLLR